MVNTGPLFSLAWQERYSKIVERSMIATIRITDPKESTTTYDPETDTWETHAVVLYEGKARVQPIRSAGKANQPGDPTWVQTVLFSIPIANNALDLRPNLQVQVLVSPLNPSLLTYQFVTSETPDSSNPIERTFYCTMNEEAVVD